MKVRVAIFGTHPRQFNGYSKVVYELCKALVTGQPDIDVHIFGFQFFFDHPGHRRDIPAQVTVFDANASEEPKQQGFGLTLVKQYVERIKPDVCVVFNDMIVLNSVINELHNASNRSSFKVVAYIDQVYTCQHRQLISNVNRVADAAIAFTPNWRDCIVDQGLSIPTHVLVHGFNPKTYYPIPRRLVRTFYNISNDDFLILNLNRNQPRKRWDTCMQAFAEVICRRPAARIKLIIATELKGAWDLPEILRRELRKRGIAEADVDRVVTERIVVPGHPQMLTDDETNILYNLADIGINTCDGEGFGLCNFEQAAIGIPQIVPKIGGFLHFFTNKTAIMIEPVASLYVDSTRDGVGGEAHITRGKDYADAILNYYDNQSLRSRVGRAARAHILGTKELSWPCVAEEFARIVRSLAPCKTDEPHSTDPPLSVNSAAVKVSDLEALLGGKKPKSEAAAAVAVAAVAAVAATSSDYKTDVDRACDEAEVSETSKLERAMNEIKELRALIDKLRTQ